MSLHAAVLSTMLSLEITCVFITGIKLLTIEICFCRLIFRYVDFCWSLFRLILVLFSVNCLELFKNNNFQDNHHYFVDKKMGKSSYQSSKLTRELRVLIFIVLIAKQRRNGRIRVSQVFIIILFEILLKSLKIVL